MKIDDNLLIDLRNYHSMVDSEAIEHNCVPQITLWTRGVHHMLTLHYITKYDLDNAILILKNAQKTQEKERRLFKKSLEHQPSS